MAFNGISPELLAQYKQLTVADPPPGVMPDFKNPHKAQASVISLSTICLVVGTFFVMMRLYTRRLVVKDLWWDDYFSLLAWLLFVPFTGLLITAYEHGAGRHTWNNHYSDYVQIGYDSVIIKAIYIVSIVMVKLSILFQYLRIFVPARQGNEIMFYGASGQMVLNVLFYLVEFFLDIFQCSPQARIWNREIPGRCIGIGEGTIDSNLVPTAGFNVASDLIILALPLNRIWRLQLPLKTKLGVGLVFATGTFVCLASILRLYYSRIFVEADDQTYWEAFLGAWLYLEVAVGIIVGCMPSFPKFAQHVKSLWRRNGLTAQGSRVRLGVIQRTNRTPPPTDPHDVRRYLRGDNLQLEGYSRTEFDDWQNHSPTAKDGFV